MGIEFSITAVETKAKRSQNRSAEDRSGTSLSLDSAAARSSARTDTTELCHDRNCRRSMRSSGGGVRPGPTTDDTKRLAELERENRESERANEILRAASAFVAAATSAARGIRGFRPVHRCGGARFPRGRLVVETSDERHESGRN